MPLLALRVTSLAAVSVLERAAVEKRLPKLARQESGQRVSLGSNSLRTDSPAVAMVSVRRPPSMAAAPGKTRHVVATGPPARSDTVRTNRVFGVTCKSRPAAFHWRCLGRPGSANTRWKNVVVLQRGRSQLGGGSPIPCIRAASTIATWQGCPASRPISVHSPLDGVASDSALPVHALCVFEPCPKFVVGVGPQD